MTQSSPMSDMTERAMNRSESARSALRLHAAGEALDFDSEMVEALLATIDEQHAALERSSAVTAWQPIETAPKDGPIMLCVAGYLPCVGRWWPVDSCWTSFDWEGHFESDKETSDYVNGSSYEPTHWQPLPAGPVG